MLKVKRSPDWVQFGLFLVAVATLIGVTVSYAVDHLATKKDVNLVNDRVDKFDTVPTDIAVIKVEIQQINKKLDRM